MRVSLQIGGSLRGTQLLTVLTNLFLRSVEIENTVKYWLCNPGVLRTNVTLECAHCYSHVRIKPFSMRDHTNLPLQRQDIIAMSVQRISASCGPMTTVLVVLSSSSFFYSKWELGCWYTTFCIVYLISALWLKCKSISCVWIWREGVCVIWKPEFKARQNDCLH